MLCFSGGSDSKQSACNAGDLDSIPELGRYLEEGVAVHSSIVAWEVSWTEEPGGLQSRVIKCQIRLTDQHFRFLIRDVIRYFSSVCLPSLTMTIPRSIHVAGNGIIFFFLMAE